MIYMNIYNISSFIIITSSLFRARHARSAELGSKTHAAEEDIHGIIGASLVVVKVDAVATVGVDLRDK